VGKEAKRRYVRPVRVIDKEQQRPAFPEAHRKPVQRVQDRKRPVAARRSAGRALAVEENRTCGRRRAVEHPARPEGAGAQ
jgi:hypothetical protein